MQIIRRLKTIEKVSRPLTTGTSLRSDDVLAGSTFFFIGQFGVFGRTFMHIVGKTLLGDPYIGAIICFGSIVAKPVFSGFFVAGFTVTVILPA